MHGPMNVKKSHIFLFTSHLTATLTDSLLLQHGREMRHNLMVLFKGLGPGYGHMCFNRCIPF